MILKHTNTIQTINGEIGIKGTTSTPYLTVKDSSGYIKIGSYPDEMKLKDYVSKENNKFLTNNIFQFIYSNSKIGHSSFKLDEGLYMDIRPNGYTRFNRLTQSLISFNFPASNEIPNAELTKLRNWILSKGYLDSNEVEVDETVNVQLSSSNPLVTFNTNVINPVNPGGINGYLESENVWNTWKRIDNNRFMKKLPTKASLGSYIIISDFFDVDSNNVDQPLMPELKVRVRSQNLSGNDSIDTFNLILNPAITDEFLTAFNTDRSVQLILKKDSGSYVIKVVWERTLISTAIITDAVLYDNI